MAYQKRITEVEENAVRNLLTRMREDDPAAFRELLLQSLLHKINDNSIVSIGNLARLEEGDVPSIVVIFKGAGPAELARQSLEQLQRRLAELAEQQKAEELRIAELAAGKDAPFAESVRKELEARKLRPGCQNFRPLSDFMPDVCRDCGQRHGGPR